MKRTIKKCTNQKCRVEGDQKKQADGRCGVCHVGVLINEVVE